MTKQIYNPADKVERWDITKLVPYARNSRTHSDEQIGQIAASITEMGNNDKRIHHQISWRHAVPMILDEQHRKPRLLSRYTNTVQEI